MATQQDTQTGLPPGVSPDDWLTLELCEPGGLRMLMLCEGGLIDFLHAHVCGPTQHAPEYFDLVRDVTAHGPPKLVTMLFLSYLSLEPSVRETVLDAFVAGARDNGRELRAAVTAFIFQLVTSFNLMSADHSNIDELLDLFVWHAQHYILRRNPHTLNAAAEQMQSTRRGIEADLAHTSHGAGKLAPPALYISAADARKRVRMDLHSVKQILTSGTSTPAGGCASMTPQAATPTPAAAAAAGSAGSVSSTLAAAAAALAASTQRIATHT